MITSAESPMAIPLYPEQYEEGPIAIDSVSTAFEAYPIAIEFSPALAEK